MNAEAPLRELDMGTATAADESSDGEADGGVPFELPEMPAAFGARMLKLASAGGFQLGRLAGVRRDADETGAPRGAVLPAELPSPFDPVYRSDTLALTVREVRLASSAARRLPFVTADATGQHGVDGVHFELRLRNVHLKSHPIRRLPLNAPIKLRFELPVNYHCLIFDHAMLELRDDKALLGRTKIPLSSLKPSDTESLAGSAEVRLPSYSDMRSVRKVRQGHLGATQAGLLGDFAKVAVDFRYSYTGEQARYHRQGELGRLGFWHVSDVERWLLDGEEPPARAGETAAQFVRDATAAGAADSRPADSRIAEEPVHEESADTVGELPDRDLDLRMRTRPPKISTAPGRSLDDTVSSRVSRTSTSRFSLRRKKQLEDLSSTIVIRQHVDPHRAHGRHDSQHGSHHGSDSPLPGTPTSTLPGSPTLIEESASFGRAATWSSSVANSDAPSSQPAMDSIKRPQVHATSTSTTDRQPVKAKTKALGEINPVWNGYRSGLHLDLKTLRFAVPAFKAVRLVAGLLPDLKYCSAEERAEVNLERVREAQTWLEHSIAIYRASAAAPLLVRAQANRANAAEIVRYLGGPREVEMLRFMEQGGAFTSRFAICYVPKMEAVVVAVRGTAGLHEALADLNGEYVPFRGGVSHKGFVLSSTFIYTNFRDEILQHLSDLRPRGVRRVVCTGHSYGGSVAALLSILLRDDLPEIRARCGRPDADVEAVAFGPAPTVSRELAAEAAHVDSYVCYRDPVPSLSYGNALDLRELLVESDGLLERGIAGAEVAEKLVASYERLAARTNPKLRVAGKVLLLRRAPGRDGKPAAAKEAAGAATAAAPKGPSLFKRAFTRNQTAPPPAVDRRKSVLPTYVLPAGETYVVEQRPAEDLFIMRLDPDSVAKPHLCASYAVALKSISKTQNAG